MAIRMNASHVVVNYVVNPWTQNKNNILIIIQLKTP